MPNFFTAKQSATKAISAIAKHTFTTSHSGPRWPSSMEDLPIRAQYGAKVASQTLPSPVRLPLATGMYNLSIERIHPGCVPKEWRKSTGVEGKR
ncbi:hypothetical protein E2P81_ATG05135 [Venturia nashicola]|uniref:Uncharacterized protein n=1 Tax=Venturia nashicola TaxID=86259 RepID=A0A4Z1NZT7_9PEZI|nr:hypothetical protein E6O75_ATG05262 [Venturia nashicola]TLD32159.1 hypothetical protein E2P81_ATG05135 [Venturia nashicola]